MPSGTRHTLSELSSAMLLPGDPDGSEGQRTQDLSLRNDDDALCQAGITPAGGIGGGLDIAGKTLTPKGDEMVSHHCDLED